MAKILLKTIKREVPDCWSMVTYKATIYGYLYMVTRKFLWWELKPYFYSKVRVPYIKKPFYDGEYATNRVLQTIGNEIMAELEVERSKYQNKLIKDNMAKSEAKKVVRALKYGNDITRKITEELGITNHKEINKINQVTDLLLSIKDKNKKLFDAVVYAVGVTDKIVKDEVSNSDSRE